MLSAVYAPGDSVLHRARPGAKVLALLALATVLVSVPRPWVVALGGLLVLVAGIDAGFTPAGLARLARPLLWVVVLLVPVQWWVAGPARAFVLVGGLVVSVVAAGLVTTTTRTDDMLETFTWALGGLRRVGVDPERIGLLFTLVVRCVPVIAGLAETAREARIARGLQHSPRALLLPVVVRTVRHAEVMGDALVARGVDD